MDSTIHCVVDESLLGKENPAVIAYYLGRRLLYLPLALLGSITLIFLIVRMAPGDPVGAMLSHLDEVLPPQAHQELLRQYGLDRPVYVQYLRYLWDVARGDFGVSFKKGTPALDALLPHIVPTAILALSGLTVAVVLGVPAGIVAALNRRTPADYLIMTFSVFWLSAPNFWLALILVYLLGFRIPLFPMFGAGTSGDPISILYSLALPALTIGARSAALLARLSRSATLDILRQDFVRTAYAKGLARRIVMGKHVLQNAAIPIVTAVGVDLAQLLGGTVIIETVFARPGLGKALVDAVFDRDYPVVQAAILLFTLSVILVNIVADTLYMLIDPRVRFD